MRISDQARSLGLVSGYGKLLEKQTTIQGQISSGKRLDVASDNPGDFAALQRVSQEQARLTQNLANCGAAHDFAAASETAIQNISDQLQRASELATAAGDATKSPTALAAIATELDSILKGVIDAASQSYAGRSLFGGTQTDKPAFVAVTDAAGKITGVTYQGDGGALSTEDFPGSVSTYNLAGSDEAGGGFGVFRDSATGVDVFQTLIALRDDITANPAAVTSDMQKLTDGLEHLSLTQSKLGGIQNTFLNRQTSIQDLSDGLGQTISNLADTDLAGSITKLKALEVAYQAALAVGAKVGDTSLLNYLR